MSIKKEKTIYIIRDGRKLMLQSEICISPDIKHDWKAWSGPIDMQDPSDKSCGIKRCQRCGISRLYNRINQLCELNGVHFLQIDPAYTSQTCNKCGFVHKLSRTGEIFKCRNCDYTTDADYNASLNILNLGIAQEFLVPENTKGNLQIYV